MDHDEPADGDSDLIGLAALFCYGCLQAAFWATRPLALKFPAPWSLWLITLLFTLLPVSATFILLYSSAWHHAWARPKRILLGILASCVIFIANIFFAVWMTVVTCLHHGLGG